MNKLNIKIKEQKEYECLAECLFSVFQYYKIDCSLDEIIENISINSDKLYDWEFKSGIFAIKKGLKPKIYTNVPYLFDPSWNDLSQNELLEKLKEEAKYFNERLRKINNEPEQENFIFPNHLIADRYKKEIDSVVQYIENGGEVIFDPITVDGMKKYIDQGVPLIISHNQTLLHNMKRAFNYKPDDIRGATWGHVIAVIGYDGNDFIIADPDGMFSRNSLEYKINANRVLESVLRYNGQMIAFEEQI